MMPRMSNERRLGGFVFVTGVLAVLMALRICSLAFRA
jgi:hypothetical protein